MRQTVQHDAAVSASKHRWDDQTPCEYVRRPRYAGRRRRGGLLQHGVEVLLWAAAGTGAIVLALSTHDIPSPPATISGLQEVENARSEGPKTSSSHELKQLRAKAELSSKMRDARLGAVSGNPSVLALVE